MKRTKALLPSLLVCCLTGIVSCDHIEKSIQDTKKPVPKDFGSNNSAGNNRSSSTTIITTDTETTTELIEEYFEQQKNSSMVMDDSAVMHIIEGQLKRSGGKMDNEAMLELIRKQLKQMHPSENHVRNTLTNYIESAEKLDAIQSDLRNLSQFKGKELMMYRGIYMYKSSGDWIINISIQDPDKPENVDEYTYKDGKWGAPKPEQSPAQDEFREYTSSLSNLKFSAAHNVYTVSVQKAKEIEGAEPVENIHYYYRKGGRSEWNVYINGARNKYQLHFDKAGNFVKMDKR
jgi:hypothetical protein